LIHYLTAPDEVLEKYGNEMQSPSGKYNVIAEIKEEEICDNDYIMVKDILNNVLFTGKVKGSIVQNITKHTLGNKKTSIFKPLNFEQECMFDLLNDDKVPIKVIVGIAGSGKSSASIKYGFSRLSGEDFKRIMLIRSPVAVGQELGFFKGDKNSKLMNWNNPAKDNIDGDNMLTFDEMVDKGMIELDSPATMQGRDLKDCWIIVDEAQNMTSEEIKVVGTRVSKGSQICFLGDLEQIAQKKLEKNNGLARLLSLKSPLVGCVELKEDVRSEISRLFALHY